MSLQGIVYILTNKNNTTLYTGVTRNLQRRIAEHKLHVNKGFSDKYNTEKLVYYEVYDCLDVGIKREKQLKKWHREWKEELINDFNPEWKDLAEDIGVDAEYMQSVKGLYEKERSRVEPAMRPQGRVRDEGLDESLNEEERLRQGTGQARDETTGSSP